MNFVIALVATGLFVAVAYNSVRRHPIVWYGVAAAIDVVYGYGVLFGFPPAALSVLSVIVQRGTVATALFVIVMYCGVFSEHSAIRRAVGPIRAELSIIACILAAGHCVNYLQSYVGVLTANIGVLGANQVASLAIACVLAVLLVVLGVTSARAVKRSMKAATWKNVQRLSYLFFALIFVHELLILYPSAVKGTGDAFATLVASGVVFGAYFPARLMRWAADRPGCQRAGAVGAMDEEVPRALVS